MAKPFLKWAGGKSRLLAQMTPHLPQRFNCYHEPFLDSGALFFWLRENGFDRQAFLSEGNKELINCYVCVRDKVDALIPLLDEHREKHSTGHYYAVPSQESGELSEVERAARRTRKAASVVGTQLTLF